MSADNALSGEYSRQPSCNNYFSIRGIIPRPGEDSSYQKRSLATGLACELHVIFGSSGSSLITAPQGERPPVESASTMLAARGLTEPCPPSHRNPVPRRPC